MFSHRCLTLLPRGLLQNATSNRSPAQLTAFDLKAEAKAHFGNFSALLRAAQFANRRLDRVAQSQRLPPYPNRLDSIRITWAPWNIHLTQPAASTTVFYQRSLIWQVFLLLRSESAECNLSRSRPPGKRSRLPELGSPRIFVKSYSSTHIFFSTPSSFKSRPQIAQAQCRSLHPHAGCVCSLHPHASAVVAT